MTTLPMPHIALDLPGLVKICDGSIISSIKSLSSHYGTNFPRFSTDSILVDFQRFLSMAPAAQAPSPPSEAVLQVQ